MHDESYGCMGCIAVIVVPFIGSVAAWCGWHFAGWLFR